MSGQLAVIVLAVLSVTVVFVTFLPLSRSSAWWVRGWDYPRPQLLLATLVLLALWIPAATAFGGWHLGITLILIGTAGYHAWRIVPMTALWPREVADADGSADERRLSIISSNVLMENRDPEPLKKLIAEYRPDIVLLLETDDWWAEAMADTCASYETVHSRPQDNHYGMIFMTDLEVTYFEFVDLIEEKIPSIEARLRLRSGEKVRFFGLHPRPPTPGIDTDQRDAELIVVARKIQDEEDEPTVVAGDLNDVAWSHTTRLFRRISGLLDPRIGRGFYSSFHADRWWMRWPLDHLFHSNDFILERLACLPNVGSDHFPYYVELALTPLAETENAPPEEMTGDDDSDADRMVEQGKGEMARQGKTARN